MNHETDQSLGSDNGLSDCPFCGGKEGIDVILGRLNNVPKFKVVCVPCGITMIDDRKDKVIANWNSRAKQPPTPPTVEEAAEKYAEGAYGKYPRYDQANEKTAVIAAFIAGHSQKGEGWVSVEGNSDEENMILNFICGLFGLTYKAEYEETGIHYEASLRTRDNLWVINANDLPTKEEILSIMQPYSHDRLLPQPPKTDK